MFINQLLIISMIIVIVSSCSSPSAYSVLFINKKIEMIQNGSKGSIHSINYIGDR
jgi:hypothetical protein